MSLEKSQEEVLSGMNSIQSNLSAGLEVLHLLRSSLREGQRSEHN